MLLTMRPSFLLGAAANKTIMRPKRLWRSGFYSVDRRAAACRSASASGRRVIVPAAAATTSPSPSPQATEAAEDAALAAGSGAIYGIPRREWLKLQFPSRYLGNEWGAVHKPWDSATVRFTLAYPEMYEVGASNLGHIVLYTVLNEKEGLLCDRSYLPAPDMQSMLARHGKTLFAVESKRPLADFDTIGLSLAYELSSTNMLQMIHLAGLPLSRQERAAADGNERPWDVAAGSLPLVFAGGPTATSNPEPFSDFCDFFALGDGEDCLPEIGACLAQAKRDRCTRRETLLRLATRVEGVYVPQFYDAPDGWGGAVFPLEPRPGEPQAPPRARRRVAAPDPSKQIGLVPFVATVHDRLTIEIRRGCTRGCRFCQPGMLTRPARDVDPEAVVAAVQEGVRKTGYTDFSLLSLSCSDYLALPAVGIELRNRLSEERISLQLPSQRVDRFDENIAAIMGGSTAAPSITFAPEAGTQRLRDIINKGLTNAELSRGVLAAYDAGWRHVKLYFMIGLPGETDGDVIGIADTVRLLQRETSARGKGRLRLTLTVSNFTPKPHTPFQWHSVSTEEFRRKQSMLRDAMRRFSEVRVNYTPARISAMEDFVGRGDRRLGAVLRGAWERGACNEAWWEGSDSAFAAWDAAIAASALGWKYRQVEQGEWDVLEALGDARFRGQGGGGKGRVDRGALGDKRLDAPLPWDVVDTGISRAWLKADLQRALEGATVPDCSHTVCSECGVCGDEFGHNVVAVAPPIPALEEGGGPCGVRAQRLRLRFAKFGEMVYVGHLDLMRCFERALRRADLPVSQDESPFHTRPRLMTALALGLGATSSGELLELQLTRHMAPEDVAAALQVALPPGLQLLPAGEYPIRDGHNGRMLSMGQVVAAAEYLLLLAPAAEEPEVEGEALPPPPLPTPAAPLPTPAPAQWAQWVAELLECDSFPYRKQRKPIKGKPGKRDRPEEGAPMDLRPALLSLAHVAGNAAEEAAAAGDALAADVLHAHWPATPPAGAATVRFRGAFGIDDVTGGLLGPELLAEMLGTVAGMRLEVLQVHRLAVETSDMTMPPAEARVAAVANEALAVTMRLRAEQKAVLEAAAAEHWREAGGSARTRGGSVAKTTSSRGSARGAR